MDDGVDEETAAAAALLMAVVVVEELTRESSHVVKRRKKNSTSVGRCRRLGVTIVTGLTALTHCGDADTPEWLQWNTAKQTSRPSFVLFILAAFFGASSSAEVMKRHGEREGDRSVSVITLDKMLGS